MVRLKVVNPAVFRTLAGKFQFQNGSIKRSRNGKDGALPAGFNSKMVRLKGELYKGNLAINSEFQFQNGSIKSVSVTLRYARLFLFQLQNGSIKSFNSASAAVT